MGSWAIQRRCTLSRRPRLPRTVGALLLLLRLPVERHAGSRWLRRDSVLYPWAVAALRCAAAQPVLSHHAPGVSPGTGIMALTRTSSRTAARPQASGAVKAPSDCATSTTSRRPPMASRTSRVYSADRHFPRHRVDRRQRLHGQLLEAGERRGSSTRLRRQLPGPERRHSPQGQPNPTARTCIQDVATLRWIPFQRRSHLLIFARLVQAGSESVMESIVGPRWRTAERVMHSFGTV